MRRLACSDGLLCCDFWVMLLVGFVKVTVWHLGDPSAADFADSRELLISLDQERGTTRDQTSTIDPSSTAERLNS
jgi:hypothetical protein